MKTFSKLILLSAFVLCSATLSAQKFGTINSEELMALMPEIDSMQIKMQAYQAELQEQIEEIQVEYNKKRDDYVTKLSTMTDAVKQLKERELNEIQRRAQDFAQGAEQDLYAKRQELLAPIIARAENAIKKVGKDNGFTMIFDSSVGAAIYVNESTVINILSMVKKELGIPENAKPRAAVAAPAAGAQR